MYIYPIAVGAVSGVVLGFWYGVRRGTRRTVRDNPALVALIDIVADRIFSFLEASGLDTEAQGALLTDLQEKINGRRNELRGAIEDAIRKVPLLGGIGTRLAGKVWEMAMQLPEAMFLEIDLGAVAEGDPRQRVKGAVLPRLNDMLDRGAKSAFTRPLFASYALVVILVLLPVLILLF